MIEKKCVVCGDQFKVYKSRKDAKFCSRDCYLRSEHNPNNRKEKIQVSCVYCGTLFERIPSLVERTEKNFCNYNCMARWQSENLTREDHPSWSGGSETCVCEKCGEEYEEISSRKERTRFCSKSCHMEWFTAKGPENPWWRGGKEGFGDEWTKKREKAIERDNSECQICGESELIDVHHIIPRREFQNADEADFLENLVVLCRPHHVKVERKTDKWLDEVEVRSKTSRKCARVLREMVNEF